MIPVYAIRRTDGTLLDFGKCPHVSASKPNIETLLRPGEELVELVAVPADQWHKLGADLNRLHGQLNTIEQEVQTLRRIRQGRGW